MTSAPCSPPCATRGRSIGEVIAGSIGLRAKRLFVIFSFLTLVLVVGAFASIVAGTFNGFMSDASGALVHNHVNGSTATISLLFIVLAVIFGLLVYRFEMPLGRGHPCWAWRASWASSPWACASPSMRATIPGCGCWGLYILVASVTPVWILLQPRDYLSSFLLYAMMLAAVGGHRGRASGHRAARLHLLRGQRPVPFPGPVRDRGLRGHLGLPFAGGLGHHVQTVEQRA